MTDRRPVRATYEFFEDLDRQLGPERGPDGEPSTADFQTIELLRIVDQFAEQFDELPEFCGDSYSVEPLPFRRRVRTVWWSPRAAAWWMGSARP